MQKRKTALLQYRFNKAIVSEGTYENGPGAYETSRAHDMIFSSQTTPIISVLLWKFIRKRTIKTTTFVYSFQTCFIKIYANIFKKYDLRNLTS